MTISSEKKIVKAMAFPSGLQNIWKKWTTHEGLKTFFGYDNKIELKLGGCFEVYLSKNNQPGNKGTEGCKTLTIINEMLLSFTWIAPPQFKKLRHEKHNTIVLVEFEEIDMNKTCVSLTHFNWPTGNEWDKLYNYYDNEWDKILQKLHEVCLKEL
jgi:uncharacterized protein YndB with AHSA1/START domain